MTFAKIRLVIPSLVFLLIPDAATASSGYAVNQVEPREGYIYELNHWVVRPGDDVHRAIGSVPDSSWKDISSFESSPLQGIWWVRTNVTISGSAPENKFFALLPDRIVSAYEVYWDDRYVASNGVVSADPRLEVVGRYFSVMQIPKELSGTGNHILTLRISNWHVNARWEAGQFFFGYYDSMIRLIYTWQLRIYFLLGVVFLAMCLHLFLFFTSHRHLSFLLFALLCAGIFISLLVNYYWAVADVSSTYLEYRNLLVPVSLVIIGIAMPMFFLLEFRFPYIIPATVLILAGNSIAFLTHADTEHLNNLIFYLLVVLMSVLAAWGFFRKREGAAPVSFAVAASVLIGLADLRFGIDNLTIFSLSIIICYTYMLARQFASNENQKQDALVRSIRLENQLLKRSINPHYVLNSLTSVIVWLKKKPSTAIKLVESLSEEFRIVAQVSNLQKIAMRTEIDLCRAHLRIMSFRKKGKFSLEHHNIDPQEEIPPMIFHTLIENGLTHSYEDRSEGRFVLTRSVSPRGVVYSLFNDSCAPSSGSDHPAGTGFKYVQARLEESYPGRWSLNYGNVKDGYEVTIALFNHSKHGV